MAFTQVLIVYALFMKGAPLPSWWQSHPCADHFVTVFCGVRGRVRAVFTRPFSEFTSLPFASFLGVAVISSCKVSGNLARFGFLGFLAGRYFEIERVLEAIFEVRESIGFA